MKSLRADYMNDVHKYITSTEGLHNREVIGDVLLIMMAMAF